MTKMKKLYNLLILLVSVLFISNLVSGQDYNFKTDDMGTAVMEAEHYTQMVPVGEESLWVDTSLTPEGFSGDGFMKAYHPGAAPARVDAAIAGAAYLGYDVNFAIPGKYYIWARASQTGSGSDDSFHAALADGDNILDKVDMIVFADKEGNNLMPAVTTNNWVWCYYSNEYAEEASVDVPAAGVFNFRIYIRERDFKIDKIVLALNMAYIPYEIGDTLSMGPAETLNTGLESVAADNKLLQVYPNPVTSSAMISYTIDKREYVSIKVYNVLGEEVSSLSDEMQKAGRHEISWNAADLSGNQLKGGLYFIKIKAGSETRTVKTMLAR